MRCVAQAFRYSLSVEFNPSPDPSPWRFTTAVPIPRVHYSAAHITRVWTGALRAVPELHTLERLTRRHSYTY